MSMDFLGGYGGLLLWVGVFCGVYALGFFLIFRSWGWKLRAEITSCIMSLLHGTPASLMAGYYLIASGFSWEKMASKNTHMEICILQYSVAYFLVDVIHYFVFFPHDYTFIAHHLATLFVMLSCLLYAGHGAFAVVTLLCLAEITSGCQNAWTFSRISQLRFPRAASLYACLSPVFFCFYTIARGILGPALVYRLFRFYSSGVADDVVPRWLAYVWLVIVVFALIGSMSWIVNCWVEFLHGRRDSEQEAMKVE